MNSTSNFFFRRDIYINRITPFIGKQIVKILVGHRRVGKSYVLYSLMDNIRKSDRKANIIWSWLKSDEMLYLCRKKDET
jgi:predicted AAA+ superfamily ATPase